MTDPTSDVNAITTGTGGAPVPTLYDRFIADLDGSYFTIASTEKAEELAGSVSGNVLPISCDPRLELVADPSVLEFPELYLNAAHVDRSLAIRTANWATFAHPRLANISARAAPHSPGRTGYPTSRRSASQGRAQRRDVQDYARHRDARTTRRYDHSRDSLDRPTAQAVAA